MRRGKKIEKIVEEKREEDESKEAQEKNIRRGRSTPTARAWSQGFLFGFLMLKRILVLVFMVLRRGS